MAEVRELFTELFAYVLLFEQAHLQGEFQPSDEQVRRDIATLLEQQKAVAKRQGMLEQDYQDACFAVVAWADETILKHAAWKHHRDWSAFPLQLEYFQTRNAGEELFERLERLRAEQREVRDVYYLCLGLGFTGRYFLGAEDELTLNRIRHEQARHLTRPVEVVQDLDKITLQPYTITPPRGQPVTRPRIFQLRKVGLALLILVPLALFLIYKLSAPPTPVLSVETVRRQLGSQQCARISIGLQAGSVALEGRVASEEQRADVRRRVQGMKGVTSVNDDALQIIPRPFCEVLELLEPIRKRSEDLGLGLVMSLNRTGSPPVYYHKDELVVTVKTPTKFESYTYVDYYAADGTVGHLFPDRDAGVQRFGPNQSLKIGPLEINAVPSGRELVTVITSKTPFFSTPRDDEQADAYIKALRGALPKDVSKADIAATFHFVTTLQARQ